MKEWLKVFVKLPLGYQKRIGDTIERILAGKTNGLDIEDMGKGEFRCKVGKYRIRYMQQADGKCIITKLGTRGDIYKQ